MSKTIGDLFFNLIYVADLLLLLHALYVFLKYSQRVEFKLIVVYVLLNSAVNFFSELYPHYYKFPAAGFTIAEYSIFASLIFLNVQSERSRQVVKISSILFYVLALSSLILGGRTRWDSVPIGIETILIFVFSFLYFFEEMEKIHNSFVYSKFHFWIVVGILFYLGGAFFFNVFANQVDRSFIDKYWFITFILYIVKNIFFSIGLFTYIASKKAQSDNQFLPSFN